MTATDPATDPGTDSGPAASPSVREEVFGPANRAVTIGIVLLISLIAFEAMGVGTAMPALVADLGSVSSYAWPFVAFIAATVVGTVLAGRWCDTRGPAAMLVGGPTTFGVGLVVAGTSSTMAQLLAGRVLQGLGAGAIGVSGYVLIALVYSMGARPAVFALVSAAWVAPSLVGPPVSGFVTERWSWHWVFLGLTPFVLLAVALVVPAIRGLRAPEQAPPARPGMIRSALVAAVGVSGLSWAGERAGAGTALAVGVAVVAIALLALALPRLVPLGTFRAAPGVATVVASRALISGAFFTASAYLPLALTHTHGWSLTEAGAPLIVGSLGWSAASAWQGRRPELSRQVLLRAGFGAVAVGVALLVVVVPAWGVAWVAFPALTIAGGGMGLGFSGISYLLLADSAAGDVGFNSSSAQLADQLSQAFFVGLGGALLAVIGRPDQALPPLLVVLTLLALLGVVINRSPARTRAPVGSRT